MFNKKIFFIIGNIDIRNYKKFSKYFFNYLFKYNFLSSIFKNDRKSWGCKNYNFISNFKINYLLL